MDSDELIQRAIGRFDPNRVPRLAKRLILVAVDAVMIPLALLSAFMLRLGDPFPYVAPFWWLFPVATVIAVPIFVRIGLYHAVIRFIGPQVLKAVVQGVTLTTFALATLVLLSGQSGVPRSVFIIFWGVATLYLGGTRFLLRSYVHRFIGADSPRQRVVIYGAGTSGVQLAALLRGGHEYQPVAFVDDAPTKQGSIINGIKVFSSGELPDLIARRGVTQVLLAMPAASRSRRRAIVEELEPLPVHVRTVPSVNDLVSGKAQVDQIREVDIEDLLGRDSVAPDIELLDACIRGKSVMVTGAGGSIGSELCRQIVAERPTRLVLFELSEYALYAIERELRTMMAGQALAVELVPLLGTVQERRHLEAVMRAYGVQTVYHAAAYKHVPLVEHNVIEGVANNIFGTWAAAEAARACAVETFVLISTDKAVRPTNVMGASKRMAELVLQGLAGERGSTRFCMVRFGNVLGSSGSVVPLFREQIRHGGPVTVTHPEIIRYFMTIPEAAQLVIQAGSMGRGGDVFVLDMGEPVRIADLAQRMIRLMGFEVREDGNPDGDITIEYSGLRPGEKLYEELLIGENVAGTAHPRILRAEESALPWERLQPLLLRLKEACSGFDSATVREMLREAVPEYTPNGSLQDLLWLAREQPVRRGGGQVVSLEARQPLPKI